MFQIKIKYSNSHYGGKILCKELSYALILCMFALIDNTLIILILSIDMPLYTPKSPRLYPWLRNTSEHQTVQADQRIHLICQYFTVIH